MSENSLDYPYKYKKSVLKFRIPEYLLLCGGPSNASDRVQKALAFQGLNPVSEDMFKIMDEVKEMLKYVFQTKNPFTFAIQTSGNGGNETILYNLLDPGDKIVVAIGGTFGEIIADMSERHQLDILTLKSQQGEKFTLEEFEHAIIQHQAKLLFVIHGESTGGTLQPLEGLGALCHKHNCLLAVDAVASICVHPLFVDRWEIDAVTAGSQKAIGAPAGMCMISFSPRAEKCIRKKKQRPPYYFDVLKSAAYWNCTEDPRLYHYTLSSNMIAAVHEALAQICEDGLDHMWAKHRENTHLFWEKLKETGLELFVKKPENRFLGVTCVCIPKNTNQIEFLRHLKTKYEIDISAGHGPTFNKAVRIGLMGQNSRPEIVQYLVEALKDGLKHCVEL